MGIVIEIAQSFELAPTKDLPDYTFKNHSFFPFYKKIIGPRNLDELSINKILLGEN